MAKKQPYLLNAPRTHKQMLRLIDTFLSTRNKKRGSKSEAAKLWDVLSATRGPDDDTTYVKSYTTVPIRRAAFPKTAQKGRGDVPASFVGGEYNFSKLLGRGSSHFRSHVAKAAGVLGLVEGQRVNIRNGKVVR